MTTDEIQRRLAALAANLTDKGGRGVEASIIVRLARAAIIMDDSAELLGGAWRNFTANTPEDAFAAAEAAVAALPDARTSVLRGYTKKLADAVDYATEHSIPDVAVTPVRDAISAVNERLLPAPT